MVLRVYRVDRTGTVTREGAHVEVKARGPLPTMFVPEPWPTCQCERTTGRPCPLSRGSETGDTRIAERQGRPAAPHLTPVPPPSRTSSSSTSSSFSPTPPPEPAPPTSPVSAPQPETAAQAGTRTQAAAGSGTRVGPPGPARAGSGPGRAARAAEGSRTGAPAGPPVTYEAKCTVCEESSGRNDDQDARELWMVGHADATDHRSFRRLTTLSVEIPGKSGA